MYARVNVVGSNTIVKAAVAELIERCFVTTTGQMFL